jgi:hypothetical protein
MVRKRKVRSSVDRRTGPKEPRLTVLSIEEQAVIVGFRRHTLLPLDDCLYSLLPTIPIWRCLQRHGIGHLAQIEKDEPAKKKFTSYPPDPKCSEHEHTHCADGLKPDRASCSVGQIERPTGLSCRSPIIDTNHGWLPCPHICHLDAGAEGKAAMGRRQAIACEVFSICRQSAQAFAAAVPAGAYNALRGLRLWSSWTSFRMIYVASMRIDTCLCHTAVDNRRRNYQ